MIKKGRPEIPPKDDNLVGKIRIKHGWSKALIAHKVGVSQYTVTRWENGTLPLSNNANIALSTLLARPAKPYKKLRQAPAFLPLEIQKKYETGKSLIRAWREYHKKTQKEVADVLGIARPTLVRYEKEPKSIPPRYLRVLATMFNIESSFLQE